MNKKKDLDTILQEVLETAPSIEGYTIEGFSITNDPQLRKAIHGWHLECLEARGIGDLTIPPWIKIYRRGKKVRRK